MTVCNHSRSHGSGCLDCNATCGADGRWRAPPDPTGNELLARLDSAYDEMEATVRKLHDLMSENRLMRSRIKSEFKIP
jgi:hypothetical protein